MSALSFDAYREWFAKAQNRFANCFIMQIVPDSLQRRFDYVSVSAPGIYQTWLFTHGSRGGSIWAVWRPRVLVNEVWAVLAEPFLLFSCKIRSWKLCFRQFGVHLVNAAWSNIKFYVKQLVQKYSRISEIIANFVLKHFTLPHPVNCDQTAQTSVIKAGV